MQGLGWELKSQPGDRQHSLKLETVSSNVFSFIHTIFQIPQIDTDEINLDDMLIIIH